MGKRVLGVWSVALGAFAGASLWVSLGAMAIVDVESGARVAALPPLWMLAASTIAGGVLAWFSRLGERRAWPCAVLILLWLPYLPGRWPAVFAVWQGPLEILVWCAVLGGMAWAEPSTWSDRLARIVLDAKRAPYIAAAVAAVAYGVTAVNIAERIPNGDEPHYLVITQSLLRDHDLKIQNNHERGDYTAYFFGELRPHYLRRGIDEQIYSIHSPGLSVIVLPAFAIAGYPGAVATVIAMTAAASAITWWVAWLLTASAGAAWFGWAAVFLTTPFFFHGFTLYPDGVGALLVMSGVWLVTMLELKRPIGQRSLASAGFAIGILPWLHTRFSVLAVALCAIVCLRLIEGERRLARIVTFLVAPVVLVALWLGYFWIIWGVPDPSAPYGGNTQTAFGYISRGVTGLLIDQQFGVLFTAPIYLLALAGVVPAGRERRRLSLELFLIVAPYVSAASSFAMWWGGVSSPARFVAAILPIAAIPTAFWWHRRPSAGWRSFGLLLLLVSVLGTVARVLVEHGALIYNDRNGFDLLLDWGSQAVNLPIAFPSVHRGPGAFADALYWAVAIAGAAVVAWWASRPRRNASTAWTTVTLTTAMAAMGAMTMVWARHSDSGVTPTSSQLAFLRDWNPQWETTRLLLRPWRVLSEDELAKRIEVGSSTRGQQNAADAALFTSSALPAADYDVVIEGRGTLAGELTVRVGRLDQLTERWPLQGVHPGLTGLTLHLPVPVHSVVIRGDEAAKASVTKVTLRLHKLLPNAYDAVPYALRSSRYGRVRVFFMDAAAFTEPSGFWTRGQEATTVVIDVDETARAQGLPIRIRSGPVPTTVDFAVGEWSKRLTFTADQTQEVTLPALTGHDSWVLRIDTSAKFSPRDRDPANRDFRRLGVWVEFPEANRQ